MNRMRAEALMSIVVGSSIVGVEVGVMYGQLSYALLTNTRLKKLFGVDPWEGQYKPSYYRRWSKEQLDGLVAAVSASLDKFGDRWEMIRMYSLEAAAVLPNDLDFVYLDGDHSYGNVKKEIEAFEPKIKSGGILCGHDYYGKDDGVQKAVDECGRGKALQVWEPVNMWWWMVE